MMTWTKFGDKFPDELDFLYYDSDNQAVIIAYKWNDTSCRSCPYYCNADKCMWTFDDCCCDLVIKPDDYWMPLPELPRG